MTIDPSSL